MSTSNATDRLRNTECRRRSWLAAILLPWLAGCASFSGASKAESIPLRTGKIVAVGLLAELHPTRPDRCAWPGSEFHQQLGYVVMYRSQVGYRTRVVALNGEPRVSLGDAVSVDASTCDAVAVSNAAL